MFKKFAVRMTLVLALVLGLMASTTATTHANHSRTHTICSAMVNKLNEYRSPDARILFALCALGRERSQKFAKYDRAWHNIDYAINRLDSWGLDWGQEICGIGEVIGQTAATSGQGRRFIRLWMNSDSHDFIASSFYNRAGGSYTEDSNSSYTYSAFYVARSC